MVEEMYLTKVIQSIKKRESEKQNKTKQKKKIQKIMKRKRKIIDDVIKEKSPKTT